jgi:hypothetical protein
MGFLAKLFNARPREKLKGISLGKDAFWEVSPMADFPSLLRALPLLLPQNSILYLEGGTPPTEIKAFLDAHCISEVSHLAIGTIRPRPQVFHLPATTENLNQLAELAEKCNALQVAIHLHAYRDGQVLFEWYDAFWKAPFYLSSAISEEKLKEFCAALSLRYKKYGGKR